MHGGSEQWEDGGEWEDARVGELGCGRDAGADVGAGSCGRDDGCGGGCGDVVVRGEDKRRGEKRRWW